MSDLTEKSIPVVPSMVPSMLKAIFSAIKTVAAAGSVAHAVENHRQPSDEALRQLGLDEVRFKRYY